MTNDLCILRLLSFECSGVSNSEKKTSLDYIQFQQYQKNAFTQLSFLISFQFLFQLAKAFAKADLNAPEQSSILTRLVEKFSVSVSELVG